MKLVVCCYTFVEDRGNMLEYILKLLDVNEYKLYCLKTKIRNYSFYSLRDVSMVQVLYRYRIQNRSRFIC